MEVTIELVYLCALVLLTAGLLLWFILTFVPQMLDLKKNDQNRL